MLATSHGPFRGPAFQLSFGGPTDAIAGQLAKQATCRRNRHYCRLSTVRDRLAAVRLLCESRPGAGGEDAPGREAGDENEQVHQLNLLARLARPAEGGWCANRCPHGRWDSVIGEGGGR